MGNVQIVEQLLLSWCVTCTLSVRFIKNTFMDSRDTHLAGNSSHYEQTSQSGTTKACQPDVLNGFWGTERRTCEENHPYTEWLAGKLNLLGTNTSLCNWILDFLRGLRHLAQKTTKLSTGCPVSIFITTSQAKTLHNVSHIILQI